MLVTNPAKAGTWNLAFNHFHYPSFRKDSLSGFVLGFAERHEIRANERTIERDIDCFVRTYTPARSTDRQVLEDSFNCPLVELGVLQLQPDGVTYQFSIGPKPTLPVEIFGVALLSFFDLAGGSRQTLSLQECLYQDSSPGQVFKLDEGSLVDYIEELQEITHGDIAVDETAGLKQLYRRKPIDPHQLLRSYYDGQALLMLQATPSQRFLRSVRIDRDVQRADAVAGYVVTPHVRHVLGRIAEALALNSAERAWTITGPYGTGKSAFALFLIRLLSAQDRDSSEAWALLREHDVALTEQLLKQLDGRRFLPVPVTARRTSLAHCVLEAVSNCLDQLPPSEESGELRLRLSDSLNTDDPSPIDDHEVIACTGSAAIDCYDRWFRRRRTRSR